MCPFPGSPPALQHLMGGQVDIMFDGMATSLPQIKGGKLKAYGVASKTRSVHLPDVPTMAEVGFAEIDFSNWVGTVVSAKMPAELVGKINIATVKAAMSPKVRERLIAAGFEPTVSESPEKLAQMVKADYERNAADRQGLQHPAEPVGADHASRHFDRNPAMTDITPTVLIVPGLRDQVALHWQTLLEARLRAAGRPVASVPPMGRVDLACAQRWRPSSARRRRSKGRWSSSRTAAA